MQIAVTPSYRDIFKKEPPAIESLISDIPSKVIIAVMSAMNAELLLSPKNDVDVQRRIFQFWVKRFTKEQQDIVWKGIYPFVSRTDSPPTLFGHWYVLEFIQHEMLNHREFDVVDTTPEQEYRLFQAYMIIVERLNDQHKDVFVEDEASMTDRFRFQRFTWPFFGKQFDFNYKVDPMYQAIKSFVLLDYLYRDARTNKYVNTFLAVVGRPSLWQYIFDLVSLVNASFKENADAPFKASYMLDPSPEYNEIFEALTIDPKAVQADERLRVDYMSVRKKPFYKLKDGKYVVMYWSYFYNQIHLGLLFDFYNRSGIKELCRTFPDFRSYTATNVSERLIFNGIMKKALTKKHRITNLDDGNVPGAPDGYYRDGKYVFLFEFKDVLMPAEISFSTKYARYKEDIDTKFIANQQGDKKGIRQLLESIKKMDAGGFPFDKFEDRGIKKRNLVVYPIIVYTHSMYSLPGVNSYLNTIFREELEQHRSASGLDIGTVKDVTMIDFQFFYHNFSSFAHGQHNIKDVLDRYYDEMRKRTEKWKKSGKAEDRLNANSAFETVSFNLSPKEPAHKKKDYVKDLFEALNIRPELSMPDPKST